MTHKTKLIAGVVFAGMMAAGMARADDKDVIDYREHIMKALEEQTAAIGMIVSTQIPPDNVAAHASAIARRASLQSHRGTDHHAPITARHGFV